MLSTRKMMTTSIDVVVHDCIAASGDYQADPPASKLYSLFHELQFRANELIQNNTSVFLAALHKRLNPPNGLTISHSLQAICSKLCLGSHIIAKKGKSPGSWRVFLMCEKWVGLGEFLEHAWDQWAAIYWSLWMPAMRHFISGLFEISCIPVLGSSL